MASQFARTTPTGHYLEEWPALPVFQEAKTVHVDISGWMQRRCPPELKEISINVPDVVVSVVRESARNERFLKRAGDLGINPSIGPRSLIEECVSCCNEMSVDQLIRLRCQHKYCSLCLSKLARMAMNGEYSYPPRCCSLDIPLEKILPTLSWEEAQRYLRKIQEYSTPPADRWYCPSTECSVWISPENLRARAKSQKCPRCQMLICSKCRSKFHGWGDCVSDEEVLEEARLRKWQRCYHCGAMVELSDGCYHMVCRCKAEFCYKCGRPWDRKRPCPCAPDQLPFAEDSPTAGYILATLEYAEGTAEWEASEDQRQPSSEVMHSQETEESCAPDPHRILLIDGLVRNLQAHLSEVNRLQQLSLINRQKEQVLKFLSSQQQSHHGASSFIGKLQRCLEPCIRQRTSAHGTSRFEHTRMKFPFLSGKEDVRVIKSAQRCLVQELVYDRMWFDQVVAERENMLKRYRLGLINSGSDVEEISFIHGQDGIHEM